MYHIYLYILIISFYRDLTRVCGNIPIVLCAHKIEVKDRKKKAKQITFYRKKNLQYCEISAKANYNFDKPFIWIARKLLGQPDLKYVEAPVLAPESNIDAELMRRYEQELNDAANAPLPDGDDDEDI